MRLRTETEAERNASDRERLTAALARYDNIPKDWCSDTKTIVAAARKHLDALPAAPKTKIVEVWHVEFFNVSNRMPCVTVYTAQKDAESHADAYAHIGSTFACIRVTGPHRQEVPA